MSLRFTIALVLSIWCLTTPVWADFQAGVNAANRGNYATALREMRPLAEQEDALAQMDDRPMYKNGEGVAQNYQEAAKWLRLEAAQEQALAQHRFGEMHINGHGVPLVTVSPRLRPLAEMNLIYEATRKTKRSGRSAIVWCAIREAQP